MSNPTPSPFELEVSAHAFVKLASPAAVVQVAVKQLDAFIMFSFQTALVFETDCLSTNNA